MTSFPTHSLSQMGVRPKHDSASLVQQDNKSWSCSSLLTRVFNSCLFVESEECCGTEVKAIPAHNGEVHEVFMTCCPGAFCDWVSSTRLSSNALAAIRMDFSSLHYDPEITARILEEKDPGECCVRKFTWMPCVRTTVS